MTSGEAWSLFIGIASLVLGIGTYILSRRSNKKLESRQSIALRLQEDMAREKGIVVQKDENGEPTGGIDYHVKCNEKACVKDSANLKASGSAEVKHSSGKDTK